MTNSVKVSDKPFAKEVEEGKSYYICTCGKSSNLPLCDGSHKGSEYSPTKFEATATKKAFICGCAKSTNYPLCDGSHK